MDIEPAPDTPDPADRTMQRLELTVALDEVFPQRRSMVGEPQRDGVPLGWMATDTVPAGVVLADLDEDEQNPVAVPLMWPTRRQPFYFLRTPEAPELWLRAVPEYPATFRAEAALLTREVEPDRGVRQWQLLTADENPVQVADTATGGQVRPWLLRADASYDLELDIEGDWQVYGHHVPGVRVADQRPVAGTAGVNDHGHDGRVLHACMLRGGDDEQAATVAACWLVGGPAGRSGRTVLAVARYRCAGTGRAD